MSLRLVSIKSSTSIGGTANRRGCRRVAAKKFMLAQRTGAIRGAAARGAFNSMNHVAE
jgi:hypothetical protein